MKALVTEAPGELRLAEVPDPRPEPGQLVLRVAACGICGTDLHLHHAGRLPAGTVMGHEFCGEVMEASAGLRAGQRVCALPTLSCGRCARCRSGLGTFCPTRRTLGLGEVPGAYAEYVAVAAHETVRLPDAVDDAHGALVEPLAVGLHAVNTGRIRRGERCLVIGAGPIGLAVTLWARHFGARRVVVSETVEARRALAGRLGATDLLDPTQEPLARALPRLAPEGVDVVFEAVGAPGLLQEALSAVAFRGRVVVAGVCLGTDTLEPLTAHAVEASVHFALAYEKDDFQYTVDRLAEGRIEPGAMITGRIALDAVPDAFVRLRQPGEQAKVVVVC